MTKISNPTTIQKIKFQIVPSEGFGMLKIKIEAHATILGHMTGRQLLRRPRYGVDIEKILQACAKHGVAVEQIRGAWIWIGVGTAGRSNSDA